MIKLSDRLKVIYDFVSEGESTADIGTDHGYLPISLYETGKSPKVILCDVNEGPLKKAEENIDKNIPGEKFDLRIGDGLRPLAPYEVDTITIAGMGGLLISEILGEDLDKTRSYKKLILQPRNAQDKLRKWLLEKGFPISDEKLVREGKYLCEIIVVLTAEAVETEKWQSDIDFEISPVLFEQKDPLLFEFINNKIRIENKIYNEVLQSASFNKEETLSNSKKKLDTLKELLERSSQIEY